MVWGLFPVDPLPGEHEYYIFQKGTYKVGRKGCDIIVNKDKGVSRVHAEIIIDEMVCMDHPGHSKNSTRVRIRDCSKYGTFISENQGLKEKVNESPNKETMLKDGDLVAFGTGNAKYRFSFVSFIFFASSSKPSEINQLQDKMSSIGACVMQTWTSKCTHMVMDDSNSVNNEIIDTIVARKSLVRFSWIQLLAGETISTEIPSSLLHAPTITFEGVSLRVTDPQSREQCLKGYTFLLESSHKYKYKEKLPLLLDVGGATVAYVESHDSRIQNQGQKLVLVIPAGLTSSSGSSTKFSSLPKVKEMELVSAVISGHLDPSFMASSPVLVASSCSTDETVVADSDVENETATSVPASVAVIVEDSENYCQTKVGTHNSESSRHDYKAENVVHLVDSSEHDSGGNTPALKTIEGDSQGILPRKFDSTKPDSPHRTAVKHESINITSSEKMNEGILMKKEKDAASESENIDIIYSQDLIVRDINLLQSGNSLINDLAVNFKRFRKMNAPSGNSFNNLIPFAKHPYEESDYGNEDVAESVKEEKKRKQMEAIAEDLFNTEKGRKRASVGSLGGLFARK